MRYPVAIEKGNNTCFGISVPDIDGCFSAGDTLDEALNNVQEAIYGHLEILAEDGFPAPIPSKIDKHSTKAEFQGFTWAYVDISF